MRALLPGRLALLLAMLALAGCGGYGWVGVEAGGPYYDGYPYPYDGYPYDPAFDYGTAEVDNRTDATSFEDVLSFRLAPAASGTFTGNLLDAPLPPGWTADAGDFLADVYDGESDLELGDLVTWFDVPLPAANVTTFEVF
jgi:hypothetical protein